MTQCGAGAVAWVRWLLGLLLAGWSLVCAADNPVLYLTAATRQVALAGVINGYVDVGGLRNEVQAQQMPYVPLSQFRSAGYSPDAFWYHFRLARQADAPRDWVLALGEPYLDDVQVWLIGAQGQVRQVQLGDHTPYAQRTLPARSLALRLDLPDTQVVNVYVRVQSISAINFTATLWRPDAFADSEIRSNFYHALHFGMLCMGAMTAALFGVWLRDVGILAYAGVVSTLILLHLGLNGYVAVLFPEQSGTLADAVTGIGVVGSAAASLFMWSHLLGLRHEFPRINRVFLGISVLCLMQLPWITSPFYRFSAVFILRLGVVGVLVLLVLVVRLLHRRRQWEVAFYLAAVAINAGGALIQFTMALGWLEMTPFTQNAYLDASRVQVLLMSLGLVLRIGQLQSARLMAEHAAAAAEQRSQEQRRFVAMLSHEFRNPLAAIDRAAHLVQLKSAGLAAAEAGRIQTIRASVVTLSALVDNFLTTEAIDHGVLKLAPEAVAVQTLLDGVVLALGEATAQRVRCVVQPADALWTLDRTLMSMAVGNLLVNALRYSPAGSEVLLAARITPAGLQISVTDHGPGLQPEELARLGQAYYRASSSAGQQGSGLGYHFSQKMVALHGGFLCAANRPEGGLEVSLQLPLTQALPTSDPHPLGRGHNPAPL